MCVRKWDFVDKDAVVRFENWFENDELDDGALGKLFRGFAKKKVINFAMANFF